MFDDSFKGTRHSIDEEEAKGAHMRCAESSEFVYSTCFPVTSSAHPALAKKIYMFIYLRSAHVEKVAGAKVYSERVLKSERRREV